MAKAKDEGIAPFCPDCGKQLFFGPAHDCRVPVQHQPIRGLKPEKAKTHKIKGKVAVIPPDPDPFEFPGHPPHDQPVIAKDVPAQIDLKPGAIEQIRPDIVEKLQAAADAVPARGQGKPGRPRKHADRKQYQREWARAKKERKGK